MALVTAQPYVDQNHQQNMREYEYDLYEYEYIEYDLYDNHKLQSRSSFLALT